MKPNNEMYVLQCKRTMRDLYVMGTDASGMLLWTPYIDRARQLTRAELREAADLYVEHVEVDPSDPSDSREVML